MKTSLRTILTAGLCVALRVKAGEVGAALPFNLNPMLRTFPPSPADQCAPGVGKFVIFTRESTDQEWVHEAGAWECIPSRPDLPLTRRVVFGRSSWNASPLLNLAWDSSRDRHPRFIRLQVNRGPQDFAVELYDIQYRTWDVRCLWRGARLSAFGVAGDSIYCRTAQGAWDRLDAARAAQDWLLVNWRNGDLGRPPPVIPLAADEGFWLVRKPGETGGCWSQDPRTGRFVARFRDHQPARAEDDYVFSRLSADGKYRAWVLAAVPDTWNGGRVDGRLLLQRGEGRDDVSVPIAFRARAGSGVRVIPANTRLEFTPDGGFEFRAGAIPGGIADRVWRIDLVTGAVRTGELPFPRQEADGSALLDGVPVPDYLRNHVGEVRHYGRSGLAPLFLLHLGILRTLPEYPECVAGASLDGRHILFRARGGTLSRHYLYGDLETRQTVRWEAPPAIDSRDAQEFVWVETPE